MYILESKEDVLEYKNQNILNSDDVVIASSIESHQYLNNENIVHEIVDEYFTKSDYDKINSTSVNFALNWYKQEGIELAFEELNIGYLLESELEHFFLKHVRRFICLNKIISEKNPTKIFVGTLYNITKIITENKEIEVIQWKINNEIKLDMDKIEIPFPLTKSYRLKISRKKYLAIKNIIEKFVIVNSKISPDLQSILLLDFNPVFFSDLLATLSQNFENVILFNQRRPAIWNLKSLKLVKNYNCKVLRLDDFNNDDIKEEIIKNEKIFLKKIDQIKNSTELSTYFKIEEYSLWDIIKTELIPILKNQSKEMIHRNIIIKKIFDRTKILCVLEWAYTGFEERIVNHEAKKRKIPIIFLQHSIIAENSTYDNFLPFQPTLPNNDDKIMVYGDETSNFIKSKNISKNNIILSGSPRHDEFFQAKQSIKNKNTVIIATSSAFSIYTANGNDIRSYEKWKQTMQKILFTIKKFPGKKPIIKLHPAREYHDIKSFIQQIDKNIEIYKDQKPIDFLKNCDILICTNLSTILLEAMILGKPTMMIATQNQNLQDEPIVKNNATLFISEIDEIESGLNKILNDGEFRENLIKNANNYINQYFINQGNASENLAKKLSQIK